MTATKLNPPLKWAGGKRWLVPYLLPLRNKYRDRKLVEPFCGGLAVALGLLPHKALLNDMNSHLINFYQWLQKGLIIDMKMVNEQDFYYDARLQFNQLIKTEAVESKRAAELFYYLNRTGFNGLCRFNKKGEFNVPFGSYKRIGYRRDFTAYRLELKRWKFKKGDFADLDLAEADFVYADPPYDVEFTQYSQTDFTWEDQVRLAKWLAEHPGPVIASNQATNRIIELYLTLGFELIFLEAPRRISATGDRTPAREILALKGVTM